MGFGQHGFQRQGKRDLLLRDSNSRACLKDRVALHRIEFVNCRSIAQALFRCVGTQDTMQLTITFWLSLEPP